MMMGVGLEGWLATKTKGAEDERKGKTKSEKLKRRGRGYIAGPGWNEVI
jgi:hypothetical protein